MAHLIRPDGTVTVVAPKAAQFTLEELYGLIEATTIAIVAPKVQSGFLVIDEEGLLKQRPYNPAASAIYGREPLDMIVGPALLCYRHEID